MDTYQSSQACGQRDDAEPKQHKAGREDLSDYQNRAQDDPENPDVVSHSALKSATKRHKMHKRKAISPFVSSFPFFVPLVPFCGLYPTSKDSSKQTRCLPAALPGGA